eukprot:355161-Chlamydomonas_euryale.AAC.1
MIYDRHRQAHPLASTPPPSACLPSHFIAFPPAWPAASTRPCVGSPVHVHMPAAAVLCMLRPRASRYAMLRGPLLHPQSTPGTRCSAAPCCIHLRANGLPAMPSVC